MGVNPVGALLGGADAGRGMAAGTARKPGIGLGVGDLIRMLGRESGDCVELALILFSSRTRFPSGLLWLPSSLPKDILVGCEVCYWLSAGEIVGFRVAQG